MSWRNESLLTAAAIHNNSSNNGAGSSSLSSTYGSTLPSIANSTRLSVPALPTHSAKSSSTGGHPNSAVSRWSYEPDGQTIMPGTSATKLPQLVDPSTNRRANSYTAESSSTRRRAKRSQKKKSTIRAAASVDRNNNEQSNDKRSHGGSKRRRRIHVDTKEQQEKESRNEGVVTQSDAVKSVGGRQEVRKLYDVWDCIGDGNFATVSNAYRREDNSKWALKEIDKRNVKGKVYYIENEVELMLSCSHSNICKLKEAFKSPTSYYLILELVENGDLFDAIKAHGKLVESTAVGIVADVASALAYLHNQTIVHRDIKPENVLLTLDYRAKIADFGLACKVLGPLYRVCGTPTYVAPEILSEKGYGYLVDVWSLGIIAHIMLVGYAPFRNPNRSELFRMIQKAHFSLELPGWDKVSEGAKDCLRRVLVRDPEKRITAKELLRNKWLRRKQSLREE